MNDTSLPRPVRFYRSAIVLFYQFAILLGIYSIGILALYFTRNYRMNGPLHSTQSINLLYKLGGMVLFLEMTRRHFDELLIFGKNRVIHLKGRLSLRLTKVSLSYRDIAEVRVDQNIWGRVFGFGTLQFATPATDTREIVFPFLPFPQSISRQAELLIGESRHISVDEGSNE
jgi:hypothetical protein